MGISSGTHYNRLIIIAAVLFFVVNKFKKTTYFPVQCTLSHNVKSTYYYYRINVVICYYNMRQWFIYVNLKEKNQKTTYIIFDVHIRFFQLPKKKWFFFRLLKSTHWCGLVEKTVVEILLWTYKILCARDVIITIDIILRSASTYNLYTLVYTCIQNTSQHISIPS